VRTITERQSWSKKDLRRRCENLRAVAERRKLATADELAAFWPGGEENTEPGAGAWIYCYASYVRIMGRDEDGSAFQRAKQARLDQALADALACVPESVRCDDGETRTVHPKSYHALRWLDSLDRQLSVVLEQASREVETTADYAVQALAPLAESLCVRLWAWVLTEKGPGLPFDEEQAPEPPEWTKRLTAGDILHLAEAHVRVNHRRNAVIANAFPGEKGGESRLTLAGFLGTVADDLSVRPFDLLRRWSLGELFAQRVTAAQAAREAMKKRETA
jgi:hypothetical protein